MLCPPSSCLSTELPVRYSTNAGAQLQTLQTQYPGLEALITSVLQQDPRPAQHVRKDSRREFAMLLYDLNIRWQMVDEGCEVLDITPTQQTRFPQRGGDR